MAPPTKKRKKNEPAVEEITFDLGARQEYLTGFHKRKVQRAKHAKEAAQRRERQERIDDRKKLREERKADVERHVQEVNALLKSNQTLLGEREESDVEHQDEQDWNGLEDREPPPPIDHRAEYIDEDKYTTVTVETVDITRDGMTKAATEGEPGAATVAEEEVPEESKSRQKKMPGKHKPAGKGSTRKKRRNFRYENKAERKFTRVKQRSKNHKQAQARKAE